MALAKHLSQSSVSKGLRVYNAWLGAFGKPSCKLADYLARADVQEAYPQATPAQEVVIPTTVTTVEQQLLDTIAQAQALLASIQGAPVSAPRTSTTRSTPRVATPAVAPTAITTKVYTFGVWAVEKFDIGAKGTTFVYSSKRAAELHTFKVTRVLADGSVKAVRVA